LYAGLHVNPLTGPIYGLFWGTVLGLIYALVYDRLPGRRLWKLSISETKGTLLSISVWFIVTTLGISNILRQGVDVGWATWPALQPVLSATGLGLCILLGLQLGYFWDRFKPKEFEKLTLTPVPAQRAPEALAPSVSVRNGARPAGTKYCIECGEQIPEISMYCPRCGKRQE
jgi:MFS family permease